MSADGAGLLEVAERRPLDHAVIEADGVPWDVPRSSPRPGPPPGGEAHRAVQVRPGRPPVTGWCSCPARLAPEQIAQLVQPGPDRTAPFLLTATTSSERGP